MGLKVFIFLIVSTKKHHLHERGYTIKETSHALSILIYLFHPFGIFFLLYHFVFVHLINSWLGCLSGHFQCHCGVAISNSQPNRKIFFLLRPMLCLQCLLNNVRMFVAGLTLVTQIERIGQQHGVLNFCLLRKLFVYLKFGLHNKKKL